MFVPGLTCWYRAEQLDMSPRALSPVSTSYPGVDGKPLTTQVTFLTHSVQSPNKWHHLKVENKYWRQVRSLADKTGLNNINCHYLNCHWLKPTCN